MDYNGFGLYVGFGEDCLYIPLLNNKLSIDRKVWSLGGVVLGAHIGGVNLLDLCLSLEKNIVLGVVNIIHNSVNRSVYIDVALSSNKENIRGDMQVVILEISKDDWDHIR